MQVNIREKECRLRVRRRQQKVVREFQPLRPLPGDLGTWLGREILPAYFYYDAKKGAKKVRGVCSACGQESELEGVRHNAKGVCPRCGREFTMKSNRKHGLLYDQVTASVVQRLRDGELVVRIVATSGSNLQCRIFMRKSVWSSGRRKTGNLKQPPTTIPIMT